MEGPQALTLEVASAADPDEAAAALLAVHDLLRSAEDRPVALIGVGGFVLDGPLLERATRDLLAETCRLLAEHPHPVVAACAGPALDAGLELLLACDLRYLAPGVAVGLPSARAGVLPAGGGQRLLRVAGSSLATRMLLLGETPVSGAEPGLERVAAVVADPAAAARDALARLSASGPLAVEGMKAALRAADDAPLTSGLAIEAELASLLLPTGDRAEGIAALLERRAPRFDGR
jgi:enoyl-CoA hydratase/carnithine racemase